MIMCNENQYSKFVFSVQKQFLQPQNGLIVLTFRCAAYVNRFAEELIVNISCCCTLILVHVSFNSKKKNDENYRFLYVYDFMTYLLFFIVFSQKNPSASKKKSLAELL